MVQTCAQELQRVEVFRVPDVLRQEGLAPDVNSEGHVEIASQGEDGFFP